MLIIQSPPRLVPHLPTPYVARGVRVRRECLHRGCSDWCWYWCSGVLSTLLRENAVGFGFFLVVEVDG